MIPRRTSSQLRSGYSPSAVVRPKHVCGKLRWDKWQQAAENGVVTGGGVYFLDEACPIARFPLSAHIAGDHNHFHLPGPPDYMNAIVLEAMGCALKRGS